MDPFHDKAGNERRASLRMSARQSTTVDGDDDEYDLAAAMGLSDGFRPADLSASHPPIPSIARRLCHETLPLPIEPYLLPDPRVSRNLHALTTPSPFVMMVPPAK
uniref:Uncharacterized protein n=1 Tax=Colletotrichum fructicola (strain Nara gc5) TaxID=1213859 RepID=L2G6K2_COLFN